MKFFRLYLLFPVLLLFSVNVFAQQLTPEQTEKIFSLSETYFPDSLPGASILVSKGGKILFESAFGLADIKNNTPLKSNDIFRIASISKQFTAVAILKLMEEGKLSLNDEITKFIPDYPTFGNTITIHNLLTHTSGIKSYTDMPAFDTLQITEVTPENLVDFFKNEPMDFKPGEKWKYDDSGYSLLGYIIEIVSGKSYCDYIISDILQPLELNNTFCGDVPQLVKGYKNTPEGFSPADSINMSWAYAAGMLVSTVEDLNKWFFAVKSGNVISEKSLELAFKPHPLFNGELTTYGYGWFIGDLLGLKTIEHSGGINGFVSNEIYIPDYNYFIVVLTNSYSNKAKELSQKIAAIITNKNFEFTETKFNENGAIEYTGLYTDEDGAKMRILYIDGSLFVQKESGVRLKFMNYGIDEFIFSDTFTRIKFKRNSHGNISGCDEIHRFLPISHWTKSDAQLNPKE